MIKSTSLLLILSLLSSGCYSSQRDVIDASYQAEIEALDHQCRNIQNSMTEWCILRYQEAAATHDQALRHDHEEVMEGNRRAWLVGVFAISLAFIVGMVAYGEANLKH